MYQNYFLLKIRSLLRKMGLTKTLGNLLAKKDYEALFDKALIMHITDDDNVFDIGANRGYYTKKFLEKTTKGKVYAFEPVPSCNLVIKELQKKFNNLSVMPIALGSKPGTFPMSIGKDNLNATSSIKTVKNEDDIMVEVDTVDNIVFNEKVIPNVLKIDVEGFELEVIKGMKETLKNKDVRVIAMEIHFNAMEDMGIKNGPKSISEILKENSFKIKWIDHSHLLAIRGKN